MLNGVKNIWQPNKIKIWYFENTVRMIELNKTLIHFINWSSGIQHQFSLTKAVEDVSQHGYTQTEALKEKQKTLNSLQVHVLPIIRLKLILYIN